MIVLKKTFFTLILLTISTSCFAQLKQGVISYTMKVITDYEEDADTFTPSRQEVSIVTSFTPKYVRIDLNSQGDEEDILIHDVLTNNILILGNKGDDRDAYETTFEEFDGFLQEANGEMTEDKASDEERTILGYKCTKTSFTTNDGQPIIYWHTNEIITGFPLVGVPASISGTCLHYDMSIMEGIRVVYSATEVSKEIPNAKLFDMTIPDGYRLRPIEELLGRGKSNDEPYESDHESMTPEEKEQMEIAMRELEEAIRELEEVVEEDGSEPYAPEMYEEEPIMEVIEFPDVEAEFPGGDEAMYMFIEKNIGKPKCLNSKRPASVEFDIEKDGKVSNVILNGDISDKCGNEILNVFESMPTWNPGESRGRKTVNHFVVVVPKPE